MPALWLLVLMITPSLSSPPFHLFPDLNGARYVNKLRVKRKFVQETPKRTNFQDVLQTWMDLMSRFTSRITHIEIPNEKTWLNPYNRESIFSWPLIENRNESDIPFAPQNRGPEGTGSYRPLLGGTNRRRGPNVLESLESSKQFRFTKAQLLWLLQEAARRRQLQEKPYLGDIFSNNTDYTTFPLPKHPEGTRTRFKKYTKVVPEQNVKARKPHFPGFPSRAPGPPTHQINNEIIYTKEPGSPFIFASVAPKKVPLKHLEVTGLLDWPKHEVPKRFSEPHKGLSTLSKTKPNRDESDADRPLTQDNSFMAQLYSGLTKLPYIGNLFRASFDPAYRPLLRRIHPNIEEASSMEENERICFGIIGCIQNTADFFDPIQRPVNLPPNSRKEINTLISVFTRDNPQGTEVPCLEIDGKLSLLDLRKSRPTKIITHGFLDTMASAWAKDMVRAFLQHGDYNIVTIDWCGGSRALYSQATANIRLVSLEVAYFLKEAIRLFDLRPQDIHMIGHSLGAHLAGYVGSAIPGLGRITGLDPAEPFFQNFPASVRLDPTDASLVDVIHTDGGSIFTFALGAGFGLSQAVGHIDFYPNGGEAQPGCSASIARLPVIALTEGRNLYEGLEVASHSLFACNHIRSIQLFISSILGDCPFVAFECPSYAAYQRGECFSCGENNVHCAPMGLHADSWNGQGRTRVKMFLNTRVGPEFCLYHYKMKLAIADPEERGRSINGRLEVTLIDEDGSLTDFDLAARTTLSFRRGEIHTFFLEHPEDLSDAKEALLGWEYQMDVFDPRSFCLFFCKRDLTLATLTLVGLETSVANKERSDGGPSEVIMCHVQGEDFVSIEDEGRMKISASKSCRNVQMRFDRKYSVIEPSFGQSLSAGPGSPRDAGPTSRDKTNLTAFREGSVPLDGVYKTQLVGDN